MSMKRSNGNMLEQIFTDSTEKEISEIMEDAFPWLKKNSSVTNYVECFDELIRLAKDKEYQTDRLTEKRIVPYPLFQQKIEAKNIKPNVGLQQSNDSEIVRYKETIASLETEIIQYKDKIESMQTQIVQFQQITHGLQIEITRLVNNLTSILEKR